MVGGRGAFGRGFGGLRLRSVARRIRPPEPPSIAAKTIDRDGAEARRSAGAAGSPAPWPLSRRCRAPTAWPRPARRRPRRFGGIEKRAVGSERRKCAVASGEQTADPFAQRQLRSGRFGCRNEDRGAIRQRNARANAGKRASEACAEAAQAFEPHLAGRRQALPQAGRSHRPPDVVSRSVVRWPAGHSRRRRSRRQPRLPTVSAPHPRSTATPVRRRRDVRRAAPPIADRAAKLRTLAPRGACTESLCLMNP